MSKYNFDGNVPEDASFGDKHIIGLDPDKLMAAIDKKIKTAKKARDKHSSGSNSWEFWYGKIRAYQEIKEMII